ncbi:MAG: hypothetical protein FJ358_06065 [Thaumarchaeota archaeon]|nr:hypothetical protein [Nitrososphaerota archaeon]
MVSIYGTEGQLLEHLALHGQLSISQLKRESGLSYPTVFYSTSSIPIVSFEKIGKEKKARIRDDVIDIVYPFLISMQTSKEKRVQLAIAYLARKGLDKPLIGGELALQMQLYVKDAEPDPQVEIRTSHPSKLRNYLKKALQGKICTELLSSIQIVRDSYLSPATRMGLISVSKPEKLLVDAIAEHKPAVLIENIAEAIVNSSRAINTKLLESYAGMRGVLKETQNEIKKAQESGFP